MLRVLFDMGSLKRLSPLLIWGREGDTACCFALTVIGLSTQSVSSQSSVWTVRLGVWEEACL